MIHSLCHRVCELQLLCMHVNVAEFFVQLVLVMCTNPFTVHMKLTMFLGVSRSEHQFYELCISVAMCVPCVILSYRMRPVVWSLLTYTVSKLLLCLEQVYQVNFVCIYNSSQWCGIDFWHVCYLETHNFPLVLPLWLQTDCWCLQRTTPVLWLCRCSWVA